MPCKDYTSLVDCKLKDKMQLPWNCEVNNKLHLVNLTLGEWRSCTHQEHFTEVILRRVWHWTCKALQMGLFSQNEKLCEIYNLVVTITHILLSCTKLQKLRSIFHDFMTHSFRPSSHRKEKIPFLALPVVLWFRKKQSCLISHDI